MPFKFNPITGNLDLVSGDVFGPNSSDDNAIVRFDGTTGKLIQNSLTYLQDGGAIEAQGFLTRRKVTDVITVKTDQSWITSAIELELGGAVEIEPDAEVVIV